MLSGNLTHRFTSLAKRKAFPSRKARPWRSPEASCDTRSITSIHLAADEGEKIPRGPRYHRVLAELPELEVIDARFGPGFSVDAHSHPDHVDSFYVLEGEAEFMLGEDVVRAGPGTWVAVPVGMPR
jgi:quercetin dioxygenase-like cupin family protein